MHTVFADTELESSVQDIYQGELLKETPVEGKRRRQDQASLKPHRELRSLDGPEEQFPQGRSSGLVSGPQKDVSDP